MMGIKREQIETGVGAAAGPGPERMEETLDALVQGLPLLEYERIHELVRTVSELPATGKRLLLKKFTSGSEPEKALAYVVLAECGNKVADDLNALVFDTSQSHEVRVRANEILTELGNPIDRDVLEMSIARPQEISTRSPWQAARDLEGGKVEESARRLAELDAQTRAVILHRVARRDAQRALPLLDRLSGHDEDAALAVASVLTQFPVEQAVDLLVRLARSDSHAVQKAARRALHSMRTSGFDVPEEETRETLAAKREEAPPDDEGAAPVYKALVGELPGGRSAMVTVAREYPNGRLQVFTAAMAFWKRGLVGARYWLDMSKSRFRRDLDERAQSGLKMREASIEECRRLVARGIRVAREVGTPIPFDVQAGKHVLGDVMAEADRLEAAFVCSQCGTPLPEERVAQIKDAAPYDQLEVETRCQTCQQKSLKERP
jgi:hypothetical protein